MLKRSIFLCLLFPLRAYAGDCLYHPLFIREIEISSCNAISALNAASISQRASPEAVAARYPGLILEGDQLAIRQIDIDGPSKDVEAHAWQKAGGKVKFLYQSSSAEDCQSFGTGKKVKISSYTNCECDTGPSSDGYCALAVPLVSKVPAKYTKYLDE